MPALRVEYDTDVQEGHAAPVLRVRPSWPPQEPEESAPAPKVPEPSRGRSAPRPRTLTFRELDSAALASMPASHRVNRAVPVRAPDAAGAAASSEETAAQVRDEGTRANVRPASSAAASSETDAQARDEVTGTNARPASGPAASSETAAQAREEGTGVNARQASGPGVVTKQSVAVPSAVGDDAPENAVAARVPGNEVLGAEGPKPFDAGTALGASQPGRAPKPPAPNLVRVDDAADARPPEEAPARDVSATGDVTPAEREAMQAAVSSGRRREQWVAPAYLPEDLRDALVAERSQYRAQRLQEAREVGMAGPGVLGLVPVPASDPDWSGGSLLGFLGEELVFAGNIVHLDFESGRVFAASDSGEDLDRRALSCERWCYRPYDFAEALCAAASAYEERVPALTAALSRAKGVTHSTVSPRRTAWRASVTASSADSSRW
ncbi:hypothetical protein [Corallococcus carmarthensis]|uniref:hypothetical protein n=1 Tax=Corallococcus carmarthensis TaxID=2316728 RepID=UPI0020A49A66|nr:hypothetical protein [Corallococcus carmarthensis]